MNIKPAYEWGAPPRMSKCCASPKDNGLTSRNPRPHVNENPKNESPIQICCRRLFTHRLWCAFCWLDIHVKLKDDKTVQTHSRHVKKNYYLFRDRTRLFAGQTSAGQILSTSPLQWGQSMSRFDSATRGRESQMIDSQIYWGLVWLIHGYNPG